MSAYQLSVAEYRYYFKAIKEYFGLTRHELFLKQESVEMSPNLVDEGWFKSDTEVVIKEHIPYTEIESLLEAARFDLGSFKPQVASFIWLIANIYFGDRLCWL